VVWAQDIDSPQRAMGNGLMGFVTFFYFVGYLIVYSLALPITLSFLQLFRGFETELVYWVLLLWGGTMFTHYLVYKITSIHFLASLIALPLIFGWTVLICTRPFADLLLENAIRVGIVLALIGAPWLGPTWGFKPQPKPPVSDSLRPAVMYPHAVAGAPLYYTIEGGATGMVYSHYDSIHSTTHRRA